ncbi:MAG TPA: hypothetical protein VN253_27300, partial [Kofleriaceae bacterium]|nr:hypothetical protein [Kofleriaceae bacterium]
KAARVLRQPAASVPHADMAPASPQPATWPKAAGLSDVPSPARGARGPTIGGFKTVMTPHGADHGEQLLKGTNHRLIQDGNDSRQDIAVDTPNG